MVLSSGPASIAVGWWAERGGRRFKDRLIRDRLCLDCGYALIHGVTDDRGDGTCPECGRRYNVAEYVRPPQRYHRIDD